MKHLKKIILINILSFNTFSQVDLIVDQNSAGILYEDTISAENTLLIYKKSYQALTEWNESPLRGCQANNDFRHDIDELIANHCSPGLAEEYESLSQLALTEIPSQEERADLANEKNEEFQRECIEDFESNTTPLKYDPLATLKGEYDKINTENLQYEEFEELFFQNTAGMTKEEAKEEVIKSCKNGKFRSELASKIPFNLFQEELQQSFYSYDKKTCKKRVNFFFHSTFMRENLNNIFLNFADPLSSRETKRTAFYDSYFTPPLNESFFGKYDIDNNFPNPRVDDFCKNENVVFTDNYPKQYVCKCVLKKKKDFIKRPLVESYGPAREELESFIAKKFTSMVNGLNLSQSIKDSLLSKMPKVEISDYSGMSDRYQPGEHEHNHSDHEEDESSSNPVIKTSLANLMAFSSGSDGLRNSYSHVFLHELGHHLFTSLDNTDITFENDDSRKLTTFRNCIDTYIIEKDLDFMFEYSSPENYHYQDRVDRMLGEPIADDNSRHDFVSFTASKRPEMMADFFALEALGNTDQFNHPFCLKQVMLYKDPSSYYTDLHSPMPIRVEQTENAVGSNNCFQTHLMNQTNN